MAQTTGAMSSVANKVEYSTNGSSWTDISGFANQVTPDPDARMSGSTFTFDGDTGIVTFGKREPFPIRVRIVYTVDATAWEALRVLHQTAGGGTIYLRWSPEGSDTGDFEFTTPATKISEFNWPTADATSADPILVEFVVGPVASLTKALATT